MKQNCDMVQDLLPLYIDEVCSGASSQMVREHLDACEKCRQMYCLLENDTDVQRELPREEDVLKKTSLSLSRRAIHSALGVLAIVVYWLVYFWQEGLSDMGDYRYFSYSFHELCSVGLILAPLVTLIWFLVLLHRSAKRKAWRKNGALLLVLLVLVCFHAGFFYSQHGTWSTFGLYEIQSVQDEFHIVIEFEGHPMVLETSPLVTNLVETDGRAYMLTFEWNERSPDRGVLEYIEATDIRWD